jgi:hypothetical protein
MKMEILKTSTVGEIKRPFSSAYPFLKLEFLIHPKLSGDGRHPVIAPDNTTLGNIEPMMKEGAIVVNDFTTVGELESFFCNHLLDVQVFRRSENLWLETTMTDGWSLQKQNNHGKEISEFKHVSKPGRNYESGIMGDAY